MDPYANLHEQLRLARSILDLTKDAITSLSREQMLERFAAAAVEGAQLAELVVALDEWQRQGGFVPPYSDAGPRHDDL
jgi:hypothetical protein